MILVRADTSPDDLKGMLAAQGVLTERGGMTSHAALVARGFGIPTVAGCSSISVGKNSFTVNGSRYLVWAQKDPAIPGNSNIYIAKLGSPTKIAGQTHSARPPFKPAQSPTRIMTVTWSSPPKGWPRPAVNELVVPWPTCAMAGPAASIRSAAMGTSLFITWILNG